MSIFKKISSFIISVESWTEKKWMRFFILFLLAALGLWAGQDISACLVEFFSLNTVLNPNPNLNEYLDIVIIGIPVLIALWYFRTYDTRQQIYQSDLFKGLDNLASDNSLQVDIGVAMLIEVSKKVPSFNETIKTAFVYRLKNIIASRLEEKASIVPKIDGYDPSPNYSNFLSYSQHIIRWLIEYKKQNKGIEYDLDGMDLSYQEFNSNDKKILFEDLINPNKPPCNFSLYYSDLSGIDFTDLVIGVTILPYHMYIPNNYKDAQALIKYFQNDEAKILSVLSDDNPQNIDHLKHNEYIKTAHGNSWKGRNLWGCGV